MCSPANTHQSYTDSEPHRLCSAWVFMVQCDIHFSQVIIRMVTQAGSGLRDNIPQEMRKFKNYSIMSEIVKIVQIL